MRDRRKLTPIYHGVMAFGGGGYDRSNLARAWSAVLEALLQEE
jgi:acetoin utilization deacetylase AcuC-like enzyme